MSKHLRVIPLQQSNFKFVSFSFLNLVLRLLIRYWIEEGRVKRGMKCIISPQIEADQGLCLQFKVGA